MTTPVPKGSYRIDGEVVWQAGDELAGALASDTLNAALDAVAERARLMVGAHQSAIRYIPDGDFTRAYHATSLSDKYAKYRTYDVMPTGAGIWGLIFETGQSMRLTESELLSHPRWRNFSDLKDERGLEHPPMPGWLAVPVKRPNGEPIGVLQLSDKFEGDFSEDDQQQLEHLAALVSTTFEVEYVKAELERSMAEVDRFRRLFEAAPDAIVVTSSDGKVVLVNAPTEQLFGYGRAELVGQPVEMLIPRRFRDAHREHRAGFVGDPTTRPMGSGRDLLAQHKNGSQFPVEVSLAALETKQGLLVSAAVRDVSEQVKLREQLKARSEALARSNAELEEFAYVASHDLQEPLRMVASYTELLSQRYAGKLDDKADKYIRYAVDGAKRMQQLLSDLLAYSRVGTHGKAFRAFESVDALNEALANLAIAIRERQAQVSHSPLPRVVGDHVQLVQLFQNLVGNAIKFRREGETPQVQVAATQSGTAWLFSITDNGIGIDPAFHDRIFRTFQRLHERGRFEGSGIGLAIAKKIVERHGGRLRVESVPDQGSTFYFTWPREPLQDKGSER